MEKNDSGKIIAIISYLTVIGWIVAFLLNMQNKTDFGRYHLRQSLLLALISIVGTFIFWIPIIGWLIGIIVLVLWIFGLVYAIQGQKKEVPLIGQYAQQWFKSLI